jgi:hypothetical protein
MPSVAPDCAQALDSTTDCDNFSSKLLKNLAAPTPCPMSCLTAPRPAAPKPSPTPPPTVHKPATHAHVAPTPSTHNEVAVRPTHSADNAPLRSPRPPTKRTDLMTCWEVESPSNPVGIESPSSDLTICATTSSAAVSVGDDIRTGG